MQPSNGSKIFRDVEAFQPGRSSFDMSSDTKLTGDFGYLYPIYIEDLVPGDYVRLGAKGIVRFQPLIAPIMHKVDAFVHYFFVPYRILWDSEHWEDSDSWETFITGGPDGTDTSVPPPFLPGATNHTSKGSLWDYFGFPVPEELAIPQTNWYTTWSGAGSDPDLCPRIFPWRAYLMVYNEFYRDENLQTPVALSALPLARAWEKDYFTSALPWQQRGTAPGIPVNLSTTASAIFAGYPSVGMNNLYAGTNPVIGSSETVPDYSYGLQYSGGSSNKAAAAVSKEYGHANDTVDQSAGYGLDDNTINLSGVGGTFSIQDLREVAAIQQWMERNARGGVRYTEFIKSQFNVDAEDYRLQRPEYIGGARWPMVTSEVLQTSSTASEPTPQGNMAGHGMGIVSDYVGSYRAKEYGMIIGLFSALAAPVYQQGIRRNWRKLTRYDYYQPPFAHLSEQPILTSEIFSKGSPATDDDIFGYQGQYDEYRYKPSQVTSGMRKDYAFWHLAREFDTQPLLNSSFISAANTTDRIFAVPNEPGLLMDIATQAEFNRPMPYQAVPGLGRI